MAFTTELPQVIAPAPMPLILEWEHDGKFTPGFVVEETLDLTRFTAIGFVAVTNIWSTNATDFTYRWNGLVSHPAAFYRVGATLP